MNSATLSVIIPVYNDSTNLAICYGALAASTRLPDEIIVVDDGSTQALPLPPENIAVQELCLKDGPHGSYVARNRGIEAACGDILVFVDADVAVYDDSLERIEQYLAKHIDVAAVFGSYDDAPAASHWISRYKNLSHHWVHQNARREATTFWTGFGAVRRQVLLSLGGFDTSAMTLRDIELGIRMRNAGYRIHLCAELQVTHLKHWTFFRMLRSDILDRAVPWTRLIAREGQLTADLNLDRSSRLSAILAWFALGLLIFGFWQPLAWGSSLVAVLSIVLLNRHYYRFMSQYGRLFFGLGALALHMLYLLYSSLTFLIVSLHSMVQRLR